MTKAESCTVSVSDDLTTLYLTLNGEAFALTVEQAATLAETLDSFIQYEYVSDGAE